jgi:hypothetical protein
VLVQQITECFISEFLKILRAVPRQHSERMQGLIVELNAFS